MYNEEKDKDKGSGTVKHMLHNLLKMKPMTLQQALSSMPSRNQHDLFLPKQKALYMLKNKAIHNHLKEEIKRLQAITEEIHRV
ncbi:hypothetical protein CR513_56708, partial [Mucuna pruriens]